jgi:hypothetical protein
MKITDTQITELYKFTREHFVMHYDVQTELVDHLANDIEQIWKENPQLTFQEARTISFKKFGVFGFMDVVEQKQKAMNKRYWKILLRFVKEWFSLPKVITTLLIFMLFFTVFQFTYAKEIILTTVFSLLIVDFYFLFKNRNKRKKKKKEKIFLLESMIGETRNGFTAMMLVNVFNFINLSEVNFVSLHLYWQIFIAFFATLLCIIFYVTAFVMPSKAEELLIETYPEYKML